MLCGGNPFSRTNLTRWCRVAWLVAGLGPLGAADLEQARRSFIGGNYTECIRLADQAVRGNVRDEEWSELLMKSLLAVGRYPEAEGALTNALNRDRFSVRLRLVGWEVFNANGETDRALGMLEEINDRGASGRSIYREPSNLIALGKAALLMGAEPKLVLENFFDQAKKADPDRREAYLASGELALDKEDYGLAAKIFAEALKKL